MAIINDTGNGMYMPVAPAYGGGYGGMFGGAGNDWWGILLLIALLNGGMFGGLGGWGGAGMFGGLGIDFPWLMNGQQSIQANTNNGFRDAMLNDGITGIRDSIVSLASQLCTCCGDIREAIGGVNLNIAQTGNNITGALRDGFNAAEIAANGRAMAAMQQGYGIQSTMQQGFCDNRSASYQNTRDIIDAIRSGDQGIMDKLCQLELDNVKAQYAQAQRENVTLQNQLNMAAFRESQANQNALFQQGLNNEVDALYNRLKNCPVGTTPVYGNQPIFTCPQSYTMGGCGCAA